MAPYPVLDQRSVALRCLHLLTCTVTIRANTKITAADRRRVVKAMRGLRAHRQEPIGSRRMDMGMHTRTRSLLLFHRVHRDCPNGRRINHLRSLLGVHHRQPFGMRLEATAMAEES